MQCTQWPLSNSSLAAALLCNLGNGLAPELVAALQLWASDTGMCIACSCVVKAFVCSGGVDEGDDEHSILTNLCWQIGNPAAIICRHI